MRLLLVLILLSLAVPVQAEPMGLRSLQQVLRVIEHVKEKENPRLTLLGIVLTMVDLRREGSREVAESLWGGFEGVLETMIPRADAFLAASHKGLPLAFMAGPLSPEARRFELLATELSNLITTLEAPHGPVEARSERQLL